MVFTDPPYNIGYNYEEWDDKYSPEEYKSFCKQWMRLLREHSKGKIILTIGLMNTKLWMEMDDPTSIGAWIKRNAVTGSKIAKVSIWEPILFFGKFEKKRDFDVFDFNLHRQNIGDTGKEHSCPKQIEMIKDIIQNYSDINELWIDLFGGSGTTLMACEQTQRNCYMMEIDPIYCSVIIERWENYTKRNHVKVNA